MNENEESSQLLETIEAHLKDGMRKIHAGDAAMARNSLLNALIEFTKDKDFARAHGDTFDRAIGLAAVCLELAAENTTDEIWEQATKLLSGAIKIRLEMIQSSSH
jgi:hypothetical protein